MPTIRPLTIALTFQVILALTAPLLISDLQSKPFATHGALSVGLIAWTYFKDSRPGFRRVSFWAILGASVGLLLPLARDVARTVEAHLVSVAGVFAVVAYTRMVSFFAVNAYQGSFASQTSQDEIGRARRWWVFLESAALHLLLCSIR